MTRQPYKHVEGTNYFRADVTMPEYPIDTPEKWQQVIDYVDTIVPESDGAYDPASEVMQRRKEIYVDLMYRAKEGLEHAMRLLGTPPTPEHDDSPENGR